MVKKAIGSSSIARSSSSLEKRDLTTITQVRARLDAHVALVIPFERSSGDTR
jgi:hypothetical protein